MILLPRWLQYDKGLGPSEMATPYRMKAREALLRQDLPRALAYLDRGIEVAPNLLDLYLQRAQIFQYGLCNFTRALIDYRHILRVLEARPDQTLAGKCRRGMRDMMEEAD